MTGSSVGHINAISAVVLRLLASNALHFLVKTLVLVAALLLSTTLFAPNPGPLIFILLFPMSFLFLLPRRELPAIHTRELKAGTGGILLLPALTTCEAHMLLMTILGILGVDFPWFSHALTLCEPYCVPLVREPIFLKPRNQIKLSPSRCKWTVVVGSFVFSQGVVSAIPLIKDPVSADREGLGLLTGYLKDTSRIPRNPHYRTPVRQKSNANTDTDEDESAKKAEDEAGAQRHNDKTAIELVSYAVANILYVLWIAAFNISFVFGYLDINFGFFASPLSLVSLLISLPASSYTELLDDKTPSKTRTTLAPTGGDMSFAVNVHIQRI
ncbi:hypothetical protein FIBSPDRAFT_943145 [Athelia psychrophila]|uniref:Uncharacterized protein n=1 Tax=Athelia psychrophila TaxID=1759441 RepID=A0A166WT60_9AGAM|nr:hypothetical protein FIBSPDRAFT_943145 [Fibularhizoctonia sp. CBS 109695]